MFMDHIDSARLEIKSAKKLKHVRYELDKNHDNKGFDYLTILDFFKRSYR